MVCGRCVVVLLGIVLISSFIAGTTFEVFAGFTPTPRPTLTPGLTRTSTPGPMPTLTPWLTRTPTPGPTVTLTPYLTITPKPAPTREAPGDAPRLTPAPKIMLTPVPTSVMLLPESGELLGKPAYGGLVVAGMALVIIGFVLRRVFLQVRT